MVHWKLVPFIGSICCYLHKSSLCSVISSDTQFIYFYLHFFFWRKKKHFPSTFWLVWCVWLWSILPTLDKQWFHGNKHCSKKCAKNRSCWKHICTCKLIWNIALGISPLTVLRLRVTLKNNGTIKHFSHCDRNKKAQVWAKKPPPPKMKSHTYCNSVAYSPYAYIAVANAFFISSAKHTKTRLQEQTLFFAPFALSSSRSWI